MVSLPKLFHPFPLQPELAATAHTVLLSATHEAENSWSRRTVLQEYTSPSAGTLGDLSSLLLSRRVVPFTGATCLIFLQPCREASLQWLIKLFQ